MFILKKYCRVIIFLIVVIIYINSFIILDLFALLDYKKIIGDYFNYLVIKILNIKIVVHGNRNLLYKNGLLIMSNHYTGLDAYVINFICYPFQKVHTIVKSDLSDYLCSIFKQVFDFFLKSHNLISYKRGDYDSGVIVKNKILSLLQKNKKVLIFPDGKSYREGIPKEFKNGIFHLVADNNLTILPVTIMFNKNIGLNKGDKLNLLNWVDLTCNIFIHDTIQGTDYLDIKSKTLIKIKDPFEKIKLYK